METDLCDSRTVVGICNKIIKKVKTIFTIQIIDIYVYISTWYTTEHIESSVSNVGDNNHQNLIKKDG